MRFSCSTSHRSTSLTHKCNSGSLCDANGLKNVINVIGKARNPDTVVRSDCNSNSETDGEKKNKLDYLRPSNERIQKYWYVSSEIHFSVKKNLIKMTETNDHIHINVMRNWFTLVLKLLVECDSRRWFHTNEWVVGENRFYTKLTCNSWFACAKVHSVSRLLMVQPAITYRNKLRPMHLVTHLHHVIEIAVKQIGVQFHFTTKNFCHFRKSGKIPSTVFVIVFIFGAKMCVWLYITFHCIASHWRMSFAHHYHLSGRFKRLWCAYTLCKSKAFWLNHINESESKEGRQGVAKEILISWH